MISNMNEIIQGLFLGNFDAANDHMALRRQGLTHILTVAGGLTPYNTQVQ